MKKPYSFHKILSTFATMQNKLPFLFLLLLLTGVSGYAQTSYACIDTLQIQVAPACNYAQYEPVCGCDGNTYRNGCYAYYSGVTTTYDGICELVDFDFYPNPVADFLNMTILTREDQTPVNLYVYNFHGELYYSDYFQPVTGIKRNEFILDVTDFERGIYIIIVKAYDSFVMKKMVKTTPY